VRTRAIACERSSRLGCRVVAVEPQPDFALLLQALPANPDVVIAKPPWPRRRPPDLSLSERTPTVATLERAWRDERTGDPDFAWRAVESPDRSETLTLDLLIERFGTPGS